MLFDTQYPLHLLLLTPHHLPTYISHSPGTTPSHPTLAPARRNVGHDHAIGPRTLAINMDQGERLVRDGHDQYRMLGRRTGSVSIIGVIIHSNSFLFWGAVALDLALSFCFPWCAVYRVSNRGNCELTFCCLSCYHAYHKHTKSHRIPPAHIDTNRLIHYSHLHLFRYIAFHHALPVTATAMPNIDRVRYAYGLCYYPSYGLNLGLAHFSNLSILQHRSSSLPPRSSLDIGPRSSLRSDSQFWENYVSQSCQGLALPFLVNWLAGESRT